MAAALAAAHSPGSDHSAQWPLEVRLRLRSCKVLGLAAVAIPSASSRDIGAYGAGAVGPGDWRN